MARLLLFTNSAFLRIIEQSNREGYAMGIGFIQDKLEIKFLILYIAARVTEPLTPEDMQDLTMCDDGIDYFDYAECLNDLVKTEHLRLTEEGRYAITDKGMKNSQICESSLPLSVRQRSDRNIAAYNKAALRRAQVQSHVTERPNGTYTVTLALRDDVDQLMELQLMVADRPTADALAQRFQREPERLYAQLTGLLCGGDNV